MILSILKSYRTTKLDVWQLVNQGGSAILEADSDHFYVCCFCLWIAGSDYKQSLQFRNLNDEKENIKLSVGHIIRSRFPTFLFFLLVGPKTYDTVQFLHENGVSFCNLELHMTRRTHCIFGRAGYKRDWKEASIYLGPCCWRCHSSIYWWTGVNPLLCPGGLSLWSVCYWISTNLGFCTNFDWLTFSSSQVPADGVLIEGHALTIDESTMTGESEPVSYQHQCWYVRDFLSDAWWGSSFVWEFWLLFYLLILYACLFHSGEEGQ